MQNIIREIGKAIGLCILGYIISYPYCIVRYYQRSKGVDANWIIWLCIVMLGTGVLACVIVNHKHLVFSKSVLKSRVKSRFWVNLAIQAGCILVLLALMLVKECSQYWFDTMWLCDIWRWLGMEEEKAMIWGYYLVPMANTGYFLMVSCRWGGYNVMQGLFDQRYHVDVMAGSN